MKRIAFIITVLGIGVLLFLLWRPPVELVALSSVSDAELNTKVQLTGVATDERLFDDFRIFSVEGIPVVCNCEGMPLLEGRSVIVIGRIEEYRDARQIRVLELSYKE